MSENKYRGIKLKNRRVYMARTDGSVQMVFERLGKRDEGEPRIVRTQMALTDGAMEALVYLYTKSAWE